MNETTCSYMDTQIFQQGLSVIATSAYIMIAALMGDGVKPEYQALSARWTASAQELDQALAELAALNIIQRHATSDGQGAYLVNPASMWGRLS